MHLYYKFHRIASNVEMSSIDDFFDFSKEFERQTVTGGTVAGRVRDSEDAIKIEPTRNTPKTTDYAKKYQDELERELREVSISINSI